MILKPILRPATHPVLKDIFNASYGSSAPSFSPVSVFSGGKVGALYDSGLWQNTSSPTGLWQDSGRTTPVTALGQPVGAIDDSSGNGFHLIQATAINRGTYSGTPSTFGSNLVTNGDFASGAGWTAGSGWTIAAGVASHTGAAGNLDTAVAFTAGKLYRVTYTVSNYVSGQLAFQFIGGNAVTSSYTAANGTYVEYFRAETSNVTLRFQSFAIFQMDIDNVEVCEVTAYTGPYGIYIDNVDDMYAQSGSFTLQLPAYCLAASRKYRVLNNNSFFGARLDSSNYFSVRNSNAGTGSGASSLISTARGAASTAATNNEWPLDSAAVIDSLAIVGTLDHRINNNSTVAIANTWVAPDTVAPVKMSMTTSGGFNSGTFIFYGGMVLLADPGVTDRAKLKTYFGAAAGLTL